MPATTYDPLVEVLGRVAGRMALIGAVDRGDDAAEMRRRARQLRQVIDGLRAGKEGRR